MGCVYVATNRKNKKQYVGHTTKTLAIRQKEHASAARKKSRRPFILALRKYGIAGFSWQSVVDGIDDPVELYSLEQLAIRVLNSRAPHGYNLTDGGIGAPGAKRTLETRMRIADGLRGNTNGKGPRSDEFKIRLRELNTGRRHSNESLARISVASKLRWETPESRVALGAAISEAMKSPEVRAKVGAPRSKHTDEHKEKIRQSMKKVMQSPDERKKRGRKGRKKSDEHRAKISAAIRLAWQDPEKRGNLLAGKKK